MVFDFPFMSMMNVFSSRLITRCGPEYGFFADGPIESSLNITCVQCLMSLFTDGDGFPLCQCVCCGGIFCMAFCRSKINSGTVFWSLLLFSNTKSAGIFNVVP